MVETAGMRAPRPSRRGLLAGLAMVALVGGPLLRARAAEAAAATDAVAFVQGFAKEAVALLADRSLDGTARAAGFEQLVRARFDLDTIAQLALGRHWRTATEQQRRDYSARFEQVVLDSYARRLNEYAGQTLEVGAATETNGDYMVASVMKGPEQPPVRLDWRVRHENGGWRFVDVVVEGVSLLVTHRNELAAVLERTGSMDGLIAALQERLQRNSSSLG